MKRGGTFGRGASLAGMIAASLMAASGAIAADTKVSIGISGWTGFAPLTLAKESGIFAKHGLDVTLKKIPQASRQLALASGDIQCAATTVETWVVWASNGIASRQIFQLDKSYGADGLVVRNGINTVRDLKGKTVAASAPGTSPYFLLSWILAKNGMTNKDVTIVNLEPGPAAQAFIAGQNDAAATYEPYLSSVRAKPDSGKILATTLDYPMVMDTVGCTPDFLDKNATLGKALADSYFEALDLIKKDPTKSYETMGADVKQTGQQFSDSQSFLRWQDKQANQVFFTSEWRSFTRDAANLLLEVGVIKQLPDIDKMVDPQFIK